MLRVEAFVVGSPAGPVTGEGVLRVVTRQDKNSRKGGLLGDHVTERDAVIVRAENERQFPERRGNFGDFHGQLVAMVHVGGFLREAVFPRFVDLSRGHADDFHRAHGDHALERQPEVRGVQDGFPVEGQVVGHFLADRNVDFHVSARRRNRFDFRALSDCREQDHGRKKQIQQKFHGVLLKIQGLG